MLGSIICHSKLWLTGLLQYGTEDPRTAPSMIGDLLGCFAFVYYKLQNIMCYKSPSNLTFVSIPLLIIDFFSSFTISLLYRIHTILRLEAVCAYILVEIFQ